MQKIVSLFKRDYKGNRQVYDEIVPGAEWVANGEGWATLKVDGTCCMVRDGQLFKRYDRKPNKKGYKGKGPWRVDEFKPAPANWEAAEDEPNIHTGHWPGWLPVSETDPNDQYHLEAFKGHVFANGTYELVGPKVQGNPYNLEKHELWRHGKERIEAPRIFGQLNDFFYARKIEGIVWHHEDGRMVKIKRKDFGYQWP